MAVKNNDTETRKFRGDGVLAVGFRSDSQPRTH